MQYFAAGLYQRGEEKEGINGFLLPDIRRESNRAAKLVTMHVKNTRTRLASVAMCVSKMF